ncbi:hypothetical protein ABB27_16815 [Stenotrophomonas terrae]|uniref:Uncharacterized protein n=1 Tax=Stenotrophomonas terrae TaxID=405446 RepID=A0A0R0C331_9GAMM|nr:hypothetical protein [Stenotrophomonas terrae]KRG64153.1 hypothetical protein ABB27_16815 [Stenotrophomonas terrae]
MPGNFIVKASDHAFLQGEFRVTELPKLPDTRPKLFDEAFVLKDKTSGEPLPNVFYRILLEDGSYLDGITDKLGRTQVVKTATSEVLSLEVKGV